MTQQKSQLISPIEPLSVPGLNVTGVVTSTSFVGNSTGTATGLSGTPNLNVGIVTATTLYGDGSQLTGASTPAFVGQSTTSQSPTTTINLNSGNVIYFTHNVDTTVAFANTTTTQKVKFIRIKDATATARSITWPASVYWDGGTAPTLINNPRTTAAQTFNLTTRDGGVTWYAYEEVNANPQTFALFSWGSNSSGQLGQNNTTYRSSPVQVPGTTWSSISTGVLHSLAIKTDGTLWGWGRNFRGELGQNNRTYYSSPVQIPGTGWSFIDGADLHTIAIKTDGTLWAWGRNNEGALGLSDTTQYSSPVQVPGTTWSNIETTKVSSRTVSLATKTDGTLWAWGFGEFGELGINVSGNSATAMRSSPVQIPGNTWSSIGAGQNHVLATKTDGTLWAWGANGAGALGQNNTTYRSSPVQVPGTTWSSVSGGLASKTDGTLWVWGVNSSGQLGQNNTAPYSSPIQIPGTTWSSISSSNGGYSLALQISS